MGVESLSVFTPDDVFAGAKITGRVLIYDDHYYMGGALAEQCQNQGHDVCLVTPEAKVSVWTEYTLEQAKIQSRLLDIDVEIIVSHKIQGITQNKVIISNIYIDNRQQNIKYETLILVTLRLSNDQLYQGLVPFQDQFVTLKMIGDCHAPGTIATAVYQGHSAARYLEADHAPLFNREMPN